MLHRLTVHLLRDSFYVLQRDAAPGLDYLTVEGYQTNLEERLADLHR